MENESNAVPAPVKPGYKTTEFWLSAVAVLVGLATASGAFPDAGTVGKVVGLVTSTLAALGYTGARLSLKNSQ